ncbi:SDR family NAD(P)-dependent oxidoreductase [Streptomyces sp. NPDC091219]|uniref:SDR family NAD(P)-dependent oxidoreductase n=1 Tax=Streptomyces sp. NPDC091219 TaxID=3155193 RepID=UPI00344D7BFF
MHTKMPTPQHPLASRLFDASATAADVVANLDLFGRTAIVTGGHSGIGRETTRALRNAGATVVVPVRDPAKGAEAVADIPGVEIDRLDLSDPLSIDAFAERFLNGGRPLHILINNAGTQGVPLRLDSRGYESQFATNHLGHFQLTTRLWPALVRAGGARVVSVSAAAHRVSPVVFEDIHYTRRAYDPMAAYGQSKTANILFARGLDERGDPFGIRAFSLHPGAIVGTKLSPWATPEMLRSLELIDEDGNPVIDPYQGKKTAEQGASTSVWCATSDELSGLGGVYCLENNVAPVAVPREDDSRWTTELRLPTGVSPHAVDPGSTETLWTVSEKLTGVLLD